jgi:hypothetical protein
MSDEIKYPARVGLSLMSALEQQRDDARAEVVALRAEVAALHNSHALHIDLSTELAQENVALRAALGNLYDLVENGPECYENPESQDGYIGRAVLISEADENAIIALLRASGQQQPGPATDAPGEKP